MADKISGNTKLYGVIGDPIVHSLSPILHNYILKANKVDGIYIPLKIAPKDLKGNIELLRQNLSGFNVTIPHKESIMNYLDYIAPTAKEYGAVNTVKVVEGRLYGYNTDGIGFTRSLEGESLKDKRVLLLGAGGAAKVVAFEVVRLGGDLSILNRTIERAEAIKDSIKNRLGISINIVTEPINSYDIIINSTPIGMGENQESPIEEKFLEASSLVYDLIYNPYKTKLLELADKQGIKTINGLPMLMHQGIRSFEIWTDIKVDKSNENEVYNLLERELKK